MGTKDAALDMGKGTAVCLSKPWTSVWTTDPDTELYVTARL